MSSILKVALDNFSPLGESLCNVKKSSHIPYSAPTFVKLDFLC